MRAPRIPPFEPFFQSARKMKVIAGVGYAQCYTQPESFSIDLIS